MKGHPDYLPYYDSHLSIPDTSGLNTYANCHISPGGDTTSFEECAAVLFGGWLGLTAVMVWAFAADIHDGGGLWWPAAAVAAVLTTLVIVMVVSAVAGAVVRRRYHRSGEYRRAWHERCGHGPADAAAARMWAEYDRRCAERLSVAPRPTAAERLAELATMAEHPNGPGGYDPPCDGGRPG